MTYVRRLPLEKMQNPTNQSASTQHSATAHNSPEAQWHTWATAETRRKLKWFVFTLDSQFPVLLNIRSMQRSRTGSCHAMKSCGQHPPPELGKAFWVWRQFHPHMRLNLPLHFYHFYHLWSTAPTTIRPDRLTSRHQCASINGAPFRSSPPSPARLSNYLRNGRLLRPFSERRPYIEGGMATAIPQKMTGHSLYGSMVFLNKRPRFLVGGA